MFPNPPMCSQQHQLFVQHACVFLEPIYRWLNFKTYRLLCLEWIFLHWGSLSKFHNQLLGKCGSTQVGGCTPVRTHNWFPLTSYVVHNLSPLFPLAWDWFRAITCVQSQGIDCTIWVFKNQLCLVTVLGPQVTAHNLVTRATRFYGITHRLPHIILSLGQLGSMG